MKKKYLTWPLLLTSLCSYSSAEAPIVLINNLFFTPYAVVSDLLISLPIMAICWLSWKNYFQTFNQKNQSSELFWLSILTLASFPFGLFGIKTLSMLKLLRFAGLVKAYGDLNKGHEISRNKKVLVIVFGALTGVHLVATTWMMIQPSGQLNPSEAYIKALYWSVTTLTTTGYGDITPTNDIGRLFTIFVMLSGFSAFGIIVGNVSNLIMAKNRHHEANREKMEDLATFMQYYEVPRSLRLEVFGYHSHRMQKRLTENDNKIISDLPNGLQNELQVFIKIKLIDGLPIFHGLTNECLKSVAKNLDPISFSAGTHIIKRGEPGQEMYIIDQGEVDVFNEQGQVVASVKHGQCIGEIALLTQTLRTADVKAKSYCDVYRLSKENFDQICKDFPELEMNFRRVMIRRTQDKVAA